MSICAASCSVIQIIDAKGSGAAWPAESEHQLAHPTSRLNPAEPAGDPAHQLVQPTLATDQRLRCGARPPQDRLESSQTKIICGGRASSADRHANKITNYGCSRFARGNALRWREELV